ncbi:M56 family metallopeptidase [Brevundimonas faecalis]|uniref:M56 family metallopeptidase n=1 Tax=Brevundimonas faecalis TaxID=947378 RepID=UPI00361F05E8
MTWQLLLELLLKSGVVAGAGLGLSALTARRPPAERAAILRAAVCLLLALPVFLWIGPRLELALLAAPSAASVAAPASALAETRSWSLDLQPLAGVAVSGDAPVGTAWPEIAFPVIAALAYAAGLVLIAGRFLLGLWTLRRWTEDGRPVAHRVWTEALKRLDASGGARLIASERVRAPLSWGLPPGTILIGQDCVARTDAAEAVLAHELAHIRRGDWLFALLSRLALALFWFNPLVWLLHAALAARTEEAADALAVDRMDRRAYARVLIDIASDFAQPAPAGLAALGMTGSHASLAKRISRIMKTRSKTPSRPLALALSAGALLAVATPLAAVELTPRETSASFWSPPAPPAPPASPAVPAPPAPPAPPAQPAPQARSVSRVIMEDGGRIYLGQIDESERRELAAAMAEAQAAADDARQAADDGRRQAELGRQAAAEGRRVAEAARRAAEDGRRAALQAARIDHAEIQRAVRDAALAAQDAQEQARIAMTQARAQMRSGADDMDRGARDMRNEAVRLRDPAYRAQVIADNRARGNDVTDAQLVRLSRSLPDRADEMQRSAQSMRRQAAGDL